MKKIFGILFLLGLLSCKKKTELIFPSEIEYFDEEFVSFFPEKVPLAYSKLIISQDVSHSHPYVWLKFYENKKEISRLVSELERKAKDIYISDDTCLLAIDKHLNKSNWYKLEKTSREALDINYSYDSCSKDKLPVPNFYEEGWEATEEGLTGLEGYEMYVLEAKNGVYMDSAKLPNGRFTPEGWTHGYSKGVAINKKEGAVIYWADIW